MVYYLLCALLLAPIIVCPVTAPNQYCLRSSSSGRNQDARQSQMRRLVSPRFGDQQFRSSPTPMFPASGVAPALLQLLYGQSPSSRGLSSLPAGLRRLGNGQPATIPLISLQGVQSLLMEEARHDLLSPVAYPEQNATFSEKRSYLLHKLSQQFHGVLEVHNMTRENVFEHSFHKLFQLAEWKSIFDIRFQDERGLGGGLLREWYSILIRDIFDPQHALFETVADRATYTIKPSPKIDEGTLQRFQFVGRVIAKAISDQQQLEFYFTPNIYKHILGKPVDCTDLKREDPQFYDSLMSIRNDLHARDGVMFCLEIAGPSGREEVNLKPNGDRISVTDQNADEFFQLMCHMKLHEAISHQIAALREGFYDIIPQQLTTLFNEEELELLISGVPTIDVADWQQNTEYGEGFETSSEITWFWDMLRSFDQTDLANLLQFVSGTPKAPLEGFASLRDGWGNIRKFKILDGSEYGMAGGSLPRAYTCFNELLLPRYTSYGQLRRNVLTAIRLGNQGYAFT